MLSVDCTFGHLRKQKPHSLLSIYAAADAVIQSQFGGSPLIMEILGIFKLRDFMKMLGQDNDAIAKLDEALSQIPNQI